MRKSHEPLVLSIGLILLGAAWLLNSFQVIPGVNWVWTMPLGALGLLAIAVGGLNKATVVIGPFLMVASVLSILRQTGRLSVNHEVPMLMIILGALMLVGYLAPLPAPRWLEPERTEGNKRE